MRSGRRIPLASYTCKSGCVKQKVIVPRQFNDGHRREAEHQYETKPKIENGPNAKHLRYFENNDKIWTQEEILQILDFEPSETFNTNALSYCVCLSLFLCPTRCFSAWKQLAGLKRSSSVEQVEKHRKESCTLQLCLRKTGTIFESRDSLRNHQIHHCLLNFSTNLRTVSEHQRIHQSHKIAMITAFYFDTQTGRWDQKSCITYWYSRIEFLREFYIWVSGRKMHIRFQTSANSDDHSLLAGILPIRCPSLPVRSLFPSHSTRLITLSGSRLICWSRLQPVFRERCFK